MSKIVTLIIAVLVSTGCNKDDTSSGPETLTKKPVINTTAISNLTRTSAISGGIVSSDGGAPVTVRGVCWSKTENPDVNSNKTMDGEGLGFFTSSLTGLSAGTKYFVRAYASNIAGTSYGSQYTLTTDGVAGGTLTYNGVTYLTVTIGTQEWTAENLRTSKFNDGSPINYVTSDSIWLTLTSSAYSVFQNNDSNAETFGYLYNYYAITSGKLAPLDGGWRIPTDDDWDKLTFFIGGSLNGGGKLKSKSGWKYNGNGTDQYGFCALPGGGRIAGDGSHVNNGTSAHWWVAPFENRFFSSGRHISYYYPDLFSDSYSEWEGLSVRLVRDK